MCIASTTLIICLWAVSLSVTLAVDCKQRLDISSIANCCKMPEINLDTYKDQCGQFYALGGGPSPCLFECLSNVTNVMDGENLNAENVRALFTKELSNNPEYIEPFVTGMQNCTIYVNELFKNSRRHPKVPGLPQFGQVCSPKIMLYVFCAHKYVFSHCPASGWTESEACNNARDYALNCRGSPRSKRPGAGSRG